jgi:hypothetical protein
MTAEQNQPNTMPFDTINLDEITEARRKAMAASIRVISVEEPRALGDARKVMNDP